MTYRSLEQYEIPLKQHIFFVFLCELIFLILGQFTVRLLLPG